MDFSTFVRDAILNALFKNVAFPTPSATLYLAFYSSDPGRSGTGGTDITTSIVAAGRVAIASSAWSAIIANGNARRISNAAAIALGNAASSITNTHIGVWTAASGGNFVGKGTSPFTTTSGQPYTIAANALVVELP